MNILNSHNIHKNQFLSTSFVSQNLFFQDKAYRTACLNAMYLILFHLPRGTSQITHLARQMYTGEKAKAMVRAFEHATQQPYSNFFLKHIVTIFFMKKQLRTSF